MGCDPQDSKRTALKCDFNPRTHVGCDRICSARPPLMSNFNPRTHVGCDYYRNASTPHSCISIHAPTWGATPNKSGFDLSHEFQSTHPRGVRLLPKCFNSSFIHFNPRTHVGCDKRAEADNKRADTFQSTHPRGVRLLSHQMVGF